MPAEIEDIEATTTNVVSPREDQVYVTSKV
jgi:hypothetical protein